MLEYFYKEQRTLTDFRRGPLGPHFDGFSRRLKESGYSSSAGLDILRQCCQFNVFLIEKDIYLSAHSLLPCVTPESDGDATLDIFGLKEHEVDHARPDVVERLGVVDSERAYASPRFGYGLQSGAEGIDVIPERIGPLVPPHK